VNSNVSTGRMTLKFEVGSGRVPSEIFCRPGAADWFFEAPILLTDRWEFGSLPPTRDTLESMHGSICVDKSFVAGGVVGVS
jgi:hypothetical protein